MTLKFKNCVILILVIKILLWSQSAAQGAGFALVQQGTAAMGQGNAFVADASDASAIFYNPAGLNQLKRAQFSQGLFLNYPDREFHGDGQFSQTNHRFYRNITAYFATPVNDRLAVGIGFFTPFGLGTAWPPTWTGRYLTTFSSLRTYNLNGVISVKVLENLSLGAGFNALWSSVELKRKVPVAFGGMQFPDGEAKLSGDGVGYGFNLGLLYEVVRGVKLGASYRSGIFVKHHGTLETSLPLPLPAPLPATGAASITYPPSVTMGISSNRWKPWGFEFDTTWTGWSSYDQLKVSLDSALLVNGVLSHTIVTEKNWHDAWAFRFGANYEIKEGMKLRAGYIYDLTPVPDQTFDPQVPDANRHIFTVGGELKIKRFTLGIAYNYILSESRNKNNAIAFNGVPVPVQANGRYNSDVHSLGLSWSFQF
jgi:long-chain fatty acid transport protein